MTQCRPHYKPPSAILPVGTYLLPLPKTSSHVQGCRHARNILFTPHNPSLLLTHTSDDALVAFDMRAGAFFSELQLFAGHNVPTDSLRRTTCVHANQYPGSPLVFAGCRNGDVLMFDTRISGFSSKFAAQHRRPTLRLPAAHDGSLCGIRSGLIHHPHNFLTGGSEDRWLRLFDLRFPFHYSSAGPGCECPVPYPLESTRVGQSLSEVGRRSRFMAFDVSPDGSLVAASVSSYRETDAKVQPSSPDVMMEGADGETVLLSLADGMRALKTIASADACAADFIQFSANGKYMLQTGGVRPVYCRVCWRCACGCPCGAGELPGYFDMSDKACRREKRRCPFDSVAAVPGRDQFRWGEPPGGSDSGLHSPKVERCFYHRAQLVNLIQSNRIVSLKSPADSAIAFTDSFCLSHAQKDMQHHAGVAIQRTPSGVPGRIWRQQLASAAHNVLQLLDFTLHGPSSSHCQKSRQGFWNYLSWLQRSRTEDAGAPSQGMLPGCSLQPTSIKPREINNQHVAGLPLSSWKPSPKENRAKAHEPATNSEVKEVDNDAHSTNSLLFPLLHPQLSQFVAACGPLHPAFVRAEAAAVPFTCRLWGGLVVGFGGSTPDHSACRRLYDGLKLWDSTTGVVLSWSEGFLVRANRNALRQRMC